MNKVPDGYDAICRGCGYPYTFANAKQCKTVLWKKYCCDDCMNMGHRRRDSDKVTP